MKMECTCRRKLGILWLSELSLVKALMVDMKLLDLRQRKKS